MALKITFARFFLCLCLLAYPWTWRDASLHQALFPTGQPDQPYILESVGEMLLILRDKSLTLPEKLAKNITSVKNI